MTVINDSPQPTILLSDKLMTINNLNNLIPVTLDVDEINYSSWVYFLIILCRGYSLLDHIETKDDKDSTTSTTPPHDDEWLKIDTIILSWIFVGQQQSPSGFSVGSGKLAGQETTLPHAFTTGTLQDHAPVGDGHSIPVTNSRNIEFDPFGFSVKDFQTRQVLLRYDSTGPLYPVTNPSQYLRSITSQCLGHPGNDASNVISNIIKLTPTPTTTSPTDLPQPNTPVTINPTIHIDEPNSPAQTQITTLPATETTSHINIPLLTHATNNSPSNQQPNPVSVSQDPSSTTINLNPVLTHLMVIRSRVGTNRPTQRLNLYVSSISPLPKSYNAAFNDPNWQNAMTDEHNALINNNTWIMVPRPMDANIIRSSLESLLQRVIGSLHNEFSMTDLGPLNYFLGISVTCDSLGMFLSQRKYATEILKQAHMANCNPSRTSVDTETKLGDDGDPVCLHMHDPREPHFLALKRILRYVWGTLDYGLQLLSSSTSSLVAYSDADWAGCPTTRRSTSGYCVFLGNNLLSWSVKRQPTLSRSSVEAEYRGVANAVAETCWLRNLLRELHTPLSSATLSKQVFDMAGVADVVLWTSMLGVYSRNGHHKEVIRLFKEMLARKVRPDGVAFVTVISACGHTGQVDLGTEYFESMSRDFGLNPSPEHYGCLVDLFCRAGELGKAWYVVNNMPNNVNASVSVWGALLTVE
ncbi:ribonuclease H-like domain-containing protein [Tanacetum coccineum]